MGDVGCKHNDLGRCTPCQRDALEAENRDLRAKLEAAEREFRGASASNQHHRELLQSANAENARRREALERYADPDCPSGNIARAALAPAKLRYEIINNDAAPTETVANATLVSLRSTLAFIEAGDPDEVPGSTELLDKIQAALRPAQEAAGVPGSYLAGVPCLYESADDCPDIDCSHNQPAPVLPADQRPKAREVPYDDACMAVSWTEAALSKLRDDKCDEALNHLTVATQWLTGTVPGFHRAAPDGGKRFPEEG